MPRKTATPPTRPAYSRRDWTSLDQHSHDVRQQAGALFRTLCPVLADGAAQSAVTAGYLHDVGKAHETWQDALCGLASPGGNGPHRQPGSVG